jgi:hypothetical protein
MFEGTRRRKKERELEVGAEVCMRLWRLGDFFHCGDLA